MTEKPVKSGTNQVRLATGCPDRPPGMLDFQIAKLDETDLIQTVSQDAGQSQVLSSMIKVQDQLGIGMGRDNFEPMAA